MRYASPVFLLDTRAFLGQMVKHFLETPPILIDNYSLKLIKLKQVIELTFKKQKNMPVLSLFRTGIYNQIKSMMLLG